jgi:hypothetical protein
MRTHWKWASWASALGLAHCWRSRVSHEQADLLADMWRTRREEAFAPAALVFDQAQPLWVAGLRHGPGAFQVGPQGPRAGLTAAPAAPPSWR